MSEFRYEPEFSLARIDASDKRFMSRLDMQKMSANVETLKADISRRGQIDPVGVAKLINEGRYTIIYGFTRTEAIRQLGRQHIKANIYEDLSEQEARILNASNNSMREDLNPWERARQIRELRHAGVPIHSNEPGKDTICTLMKMSRRSVFNWLKVTEYVCRELHDALATGKVSLTHAMEFVEHDPEVTRSILQQCIDHEWTASELRLRLGSARLHDEETYTTTQQEPEGATLHSEDPYACQPGSEGATLHPEDRNQGAKAIENLRRAGTYLIGVKEEDIARMDDDRAMKLRDGLRIVLEAVGIIAN